MNDPNVDAWDRYHAMEEEAAWGAWVWLTLCDFFGLPHDAPVQRIDRRVYKDTACGASFMVTEGGRLLFSTIVEGSEATDAVELEVDDLIDMEEDDGQRILHERIEAILKRLEAFAEEHFDDDDDEASTP